MSAECSRKRAGGDESQEDPPKKIASDQLEEAELDHDVVIVVDGHKFPCKKEELSRTSEYFKKMFDSSFAEKDEKEIKIGGIVTAEGFQLFLDVIQGNDTLTDESVELALSLADFLESSVLEDRCIEFLVSRKSTYSKEEQFVLGDKHSSMKLITRICADISDPYELHLVVPADMSSLSSNTKTILLQKSFELHGYRKPSGPPLPQQPEVEFETMIDELIDRAEIVHRQGTMLAEQALIITTGLAVKNCSNINRLRAKELIDQDPRIPILKHQLQKTENQIERNAIRSQIQVIEHKNTCVAIEEFMEARGDDRDKLLQANTDFVNTLKKCPYYISRGKRTANIAIENHPLGEKTIDVLYRNMTREFEVFPERDYSLRQRFFHQTLWLQMLAEAEGTIPGKYFHRHHLQVDPDNRQVPDGLRQISGEINFELLNNFVTESRVAFYNVSLRPLQNQPYFY